MQFKISQLLKKIREKRVKLAFAESVTCGLIAHKLSTIKGTSGFFTGSVVCYDSTVKSGLLKVSPALIKKYSAESKQVTEALAKNLSKIMEADLYGAVTGLSTPDPDAKHPAGTIFLSVYDGQKIITKKILFRGSPLMIRKKAVNAMLELVDSRIK